MEDKNHQSPKEGYGKPWFARKRFGWGIRPVSWQGWIITLLVLVAFLFVVRLLAS